MQRFSGQILTISLCKQLFLSTLITEGYGLREPNFLKAKPRVKCFYAFNFLKNLTSNSENYAFHYNNIFSESWTAESSR